MRGVRPFVAPACAGLVLLAEVAVVSCGGRDLTVGSGQPIYTATAAATATANCGQTGDACAVNADCCSGACSFVTGGCQ